VHFPRGDQTELKCGFRSQDGPTGRKKNRTESRLMRFDVPSLMARGQNISRKNEPYVVY